MAGPRPTGAVELGPGVWVEAAGLRFSFSRSGGPGGQAVNKLSTKAELRVAVEAIEGLSMQVRERLRKLAGQRLTLGDEIVIVASTTRSQLDNRRDCVQRLESLVTEALAVPRPRKPTKPTRASTKKRLDAKRRQSGKKDARRRPDTDE